MNIINEEQSRMITAGVFESIKQSVLLKDAKILSSTWAMKKKSNRKYRVHLNTYKYKQQLELYYFKDNISSLTVNDITIRILLVLILIICYRAHIIDMKGAFLLVYFEKGEELFIEVPGGFEEYFSENDVIKLKVLIHRLKQAAQTFYKLLVSTISCMGMKRNKINPYVFYKWIPVNSLAFITSQIDNLLNIGST